MKTLEEKRKAKSDVYYQHKKSLMVRHILLIFYLPTPSTCNFTDLGKCYLKTNHPNLFVLQKLKRQAEKNKAEELKVHNAVLEEYGY